MQGREQAASRQNIPTPGQTPQGRLRDAVRRLGRRRVLLFGVAASLFVHSLLMLVGAMLLLQRPVSGLGDASAEVELAVMTESELTEFMQGELEREDPTQQELPDPELFNLDDIESQLTSVDLASIAPAESALSGLVGSGASALESSDSFGGASVSGGSAQFFGVEARGSRFAYIIDVSGSMVGERMDALRAALESSLDGLLEQAHFSVILYNSQALPLTDGRWVPANNRHKSETSRQIRAVRPTGATNPWPAFEIALNMKPRPDAIYFMTDGQIFGPGVTQMIAWIARKNRNGDGRSQIHCITFVHNDRDTADLMKKIARQSGGTYTHVEGPE